MVTTTLGNEPFTIGLWVGNKVTPGTTEDSAQGNSGHSQPRKVRCRRNIACAADQLPMVRLRSIAEA